MGQDRSGGRVSPAHLGLSRKAPALASPQLHQWSRNHAPIEQEQCTIKVKLNQIAPVLTSVGAGAVRIKSLKNGFQ